VSCLGLSLSTSHNIGRLQAVPYYFKNNITRSGWSAEARRANDNNLGYLVCFGFHLHTILAQDQRFNTSSIPPVICMPLQQRPPYGWARCGGNERTEVLGAQRVAV
jgi:hypothetical protein